MSAITEETLSVSGVLLAKVFGNQTRDIGRYQQENQRLVGLEVRQQMIGQGFYAVVQSFLSITPALIYLTAGLLIANHHAVSAGTIVAFTTLQTRLYVPIGQLLQVSVELRSSLALFDRVFEYLDVVPDIADAPDAVDLPATEAGGRVALRDVSFRYPGVPTDALSGVSLGAGPGHLVALVGPSGAGKTTISYLIPRLYDVTAGAVEVDGVDVRHARQASLAAAIGVHHRQRGQHLCHRRRPGRGNRLAPRSAARGRALRVAVHRAVRRRASPVEMPRRRHHDGRNGAPARAAADGELAPAQASAARNIAAFPTAGWRRRKKFRAADPKASTRHR